MAQSPWSKAWDLLSFFLQTKIPLQGCLPQIIRQFSSQLLTTRLQAVGGWPLTSTLGTTTPVCPVLGAPGCDMESQMFFFFVFVTGSGNNTLSNHDKESNHLHISLWRSICSRGSQLQGNAPCKVIISTWVVASARCKEFKLFANLALPVGTWRNIIQKSKILGPGSLQGSSSATLSVQGLEPVWQLVRVRPRQRQEMLADFKDTDVTDVTYIEIHRDTQESQGTPSSRPRGQICKSHELNQINMAGSKTK